MTMDPTIACSLGADELPKRLGGRCSAIGEDSLLSVEP